MTSLITIAWKWYLKIVNFPHQMFLYIQINSCSHYGTLYPWVSILTPVQLNVTHEHQEDLLKLQVCTHVFLSVRLATPLNNTHQYPGAL